jgi:hypothetical protein
MTEQVERIAVLEAEVEALKNDQEDILKCLHEIKDEITRYKGFLGGVAFLLSSLTVAVGMFKDWILDHLK